MIYSINPKKADIKIGVGGASIYLLLLVINAAGTNKQPGYYIWCTNLVD